MAYCRVETQIGQQTLSLETGKLAKQAHGAVVVGLGETLSLVAAVEGQEDDRKDFFPLVVDYREKVYAAGKFPGGFIKREGRPTTKEILTSRLIDRPIRPLFPTDYFREVQIMASALTFDRENDPDILSMIGSSARSPCLAHPVSAAHRARSGSGRINGEFVVMPTITQMEESDLDLIVSGTKKAITMIEGFAREMPEDQMAEAILLCHKEIIKIIDLIEQLRDKAGLGTKTLPPANPENPYKAAIEKKYTDELQDREDDGRQEGPGRRGQGHQGKGDDGGPWRHRRQGSGGRHQEVQIGVQRRRGEGRPRSHPQRQANRRPDQSRSSPNQLRSRSASSDARLGAVHPGRDAGGCSSRSRSAPPATNNASTAWPTSTRRSSCSITTSRPSRSAKRSRSGGPGRREIGHGALAERSVKAVIPGPDKFPYTIRVVSDILESNGSSSMASVCAATLGLDGCRRADQRSGGGHLDRAR